MTKQQLWDSSAVLCSQGVSDETEDGKLLGTFMYDQDGEPIQTFKLAVSPNRAFVIYHGSTYISVFNIYITFFLYQKGNKRIQFKITVLCSNAFIYYLLLWL